MADGWKPHRCLCLSLSETLKRNKIPRNFLTLWSLKSQQLPSFNFPSSVKSKWRKTEKKDTCRTATRVHVSQLPLHFTVGVSATCPTTRLWCKDITAMEMEHLCCQLIGKSCEAWCGGGAEPQHQPFLSYMHQSEFTWNSKQPAGRLFKYPSWGCFFYHFIAPKKTFLCSSTRRLLTGQTVTLAYQSWIYTTGLDSQFWFFGYTWCFWLLSVYICF